MSIADFRDALETIAGAGRVTGDATSLKPSLPSVANGEYLKVAPTRPEQVQDLVRFAGRNGLKVFTPTEGPVCTYATGSGGLLLDFSEMRKIENLDPKNLNVQIERGVTYAELAVEARRYGVKPQMPVAARGDSVLQNTMARAVVKAQARYPEFKAPLFKVVLPDGRIHLTGSDTMKEGVSLLGDDPGPMLSKWYQGSDDLFGIPVRATVFLYPILEGRDFLAFRTPELATAFALMKETTRKELCQEALASDPLYLSRLLGAEAPSARGWVVFLGCETFPKHLDYQRKKIREIASRYGATEDAETAEKIGARIDEPWSPQSTNHTVFTSLFAKAPETMDAVEREAKAAGAAEVARLFVADGLGRAVYCQADPEGVSGDVRERLEVAALEKGAFVDRPRGSARTWVYERGTAYLEQLRRVKQMLDPAETINPGFFPV